MSRFDFLQDNELLRICRQAESTADAVGKIARSRRALERIVYKLGERGNADLNDKIENLYYDCKLDSDIKSLFHHIRNRANDHLHYNPFQKITMMEAEDVIEDLLKIAKWYNSRKSEKGKKTEKSDAKNNSVAMTREEKVHNQSSQRNILVNTPKAEMERIALNKKAFESKEKHERLSFYKKEQNRYVALAKSTQNETKRSVLYKKALEYKEKYDRLSSLSEQKNEKPVRKLSREEILEKYLDNARNASDETERFEQYQKAIEYKDAEAQYNVGIAYLYGRGTEQNLDEAIRWLEKAAKQNYPNAKEELETANTLKIEKAKEQKKLARQARKAKKEEKQIKKLAEREHKEQEKPERKEKEAGKGYCEAAEQGDAEAQYNLGYCYEKGHGVAQNYPEAIRWYRRATIQGNANAQYRLGYCYEKGHGVVRNYPEAIRWYRRAAKRGNADAQFCLGYYYHHDVQKYKEAIKWYCKAAEQGNADAQFWLGYCYYWGCGVGEDEHEAVKWYHRAGEQGHAAAQERMGYCYYQGRGVVQDCQEAVKWYRKAAEQGYVEAQIFLRSKRYDLHKQYLDS